MGAGKVGARAMTQEEFEELSRMSHRLSDAIRLEFINGRIGERTLPDGDHGRMIQWLTRLCLEAHPEWWLHADQGLRVEKYRKGNARPDGCLAPSDAFVGEPSEWGSPDDVLMVVEVTSFDTDTGKARPQGEAQGVCPGRYSRLPVD